MPKANEENPRIRGHCPNCGPSKLADIIAKHESDWEDDGYTVWGEDKYYILQCRGCEAVYFRTDSVFSDDMEVNKDPITGKEVATIPQKTRYWPSPSRRSQPSWAAELQIIDNNLGLLFDDIYSALNNDLRVLAAIGIRTVFDRASELLQVDANETFANKLGALVKLGKIGRDEQETLGVLTDAGSAAAHRAWRPKPEELETMMLIIEGFLHRNFLLGDAAKKLKAKVPSKK